MLKRLLLMFLTASVVGALLYYEMKGTNETASGIVVVNMPSRFSSLALNGEKIFRKNCVSCHGTHASGRQGKGPPLVHIIYEPSHHNDVSFYRAVKLGVRTHHWPFGNMPKVPGVTREQVSAIIAYIRELQRENGIR